MCTAIWGPLNFGGPVPSRCSLTLVDGPESNSMSAEIQLEAMSCHGSAGDEMQTTWFCWLKWRGGVDFPRFRDERLGVTVRRRRQRHEN